MIATCPACGKRYRLADEAVPAAGRNVRCAACGHGWAVVPAGPATAAANGDAAPPHAPEPVLAPTATPPAALAPARPRSPPVRREPPRRRLGWIAAVVALLAVAALAVVEFAPVATFDPPRLGLPAPQLPLADFGSVRAPSLPVLPPLDLTRVPVVGDALERLVHPPATPASPLRITAAGERRTLANGTRVLTVTGSVGNPTAAPVALAGIDAALVDAAGHAVFRWRIAAPASVVGAHGSAAFEAVAANYPAGATVLQLTPR